MTFAITHTFVSAKADGADATVVQPSNWNAALTTSMATNKMLGRATAGAGAVEEIATTGSGNAVLATSPTLTTPNIGAATGTSFNIGSGAANLTSAWLRFGSGGLTGEFNCGQVLADSGGMSLFVRAGGSGGVQLTAGATSWTAVSERGKKKDFQPIKDPLAILKQLRGAYGIGRYIDEADDAPFRPFVMYEETAEAFPAASAFSPERVFEGEQEDPETGEKQITRRVQPEHKGVSLECYVPLLLAICEQLAAKIEALEAK